MKTIVCPNTEQHHTRDILKLVAGIAPRGADIAEIRLRLRIMDVLDKEGGALEFEDADYALLKKLFEKFSFNVAHRDLAMIADALDAAK